MHPNQELGDTPGAHSGNTSAPHLSPFSLVPVGRLSSPAPPTLPWHNVPVKPGLQLQMGLSSTIWHSPWCWHGFSRQVSEFLLGRRAKPSLKL